MNTNLPNPNFSAVVTQIKRVLEAYVEATEEFAAFYVPAECQDGVDRAVEASINEVLANNGYSRTLYNQVLEERTNARFAYHSGLAVDVPQSEQGASYPINFSVYGDLP